MDGIIIVAIITFILCIAQIILSVCIVPKIPIKLKERDNLQRIRRKKRNCTILVVVLEMIAIILLGYGLSNQIPILSYIGLFLGISLIGVSTIYDRIETKEKLAKGNNTFARAIQEVNDITLKDNIIIADEKLREAIILDDIEEIQGIKALFKTGEKYVAGCDRENLLKIMSKPYQDKIIKSNIKGVCLEELEADKFKLMITTQSNNTFSTTIEKVDLPKWIK